MATDQPLPTPPKQAADPPAPEFSTHGAAGESRKLSEVDPVAALRERLVMRKARRRGKAHQDWMDCVSVEVDLESALQEIERLQAGLRAGVTLAGEVDRLRAENERHRQANEHDLDHALQNPGSALACQRERDSLRQTLTELIEAAEPIAEQTKSYGNVKFMRFRTAVASAKAEIGGRPVDTTPQ